MSGQRRAVRIPDDVYDAIEEIAHTSGRDVASVLDEMLEEAVKMRRVRGIVFADEFQRREAKVGGTGLGVWEVIEGFQNEGEDWERFKAAYHWLNDFQLRAALEYWRVFPEEIDAMIRENEQWTPEKLYGAYPYMRPPEPSMHAANDAKGI